MPSDIEIAQQATMRPISDVAREKLGIAEEHLEPYGWYKAKISLDYVDSLADRPDGKLILSPRSARPRLGKARPQPRSASAMR